MRNLPEEPSSPKLRQHSHPEFGASISDFKPTSAPGAREQLVCCIRSIEGARARTCARRRSALALLAHERKGCKRQAVLDRTSLAPFGRHFIHFVHSRCATGLCCPLRLHVHVLFMSVLSGDGVPSITEQFTLPYSHVDACAHEGCAATALQRCLSTPCMAVRILASYSAQRHRKSS